MSIIIDEDERTNVDDLIQDKEVVIDMKQEEQEQEEQEQEEQEQEEQEKSNKKCKIHPVIKISLIVNTFIGAILTIYLLLHSFELI